MAACCSGKSRSVAAQPWQQNLAAAVWCASPWAAAKAAVRVHLDTFNSAAGELSSPEGRVSMRQLAQMLADSGLKRQERSGHTAGRQRMWRQLGGRVSARLSEHLGQGRLRPTAGAARPAGGRRHWSFAWVRGCLPLGQQRRKPIAVSGCARREERCWRRSARVPFHTHLRKPWCRSCACTAITRLNTGSETGASRNRSIRDWHLLRTNLRRYRTPFPSTALIVTLD